MVAEESPTRASSTGPDEDQGLTEVVEQLGRDVSALLLREADSPPFAIVRQYARARDAIAVGVAVVAFGTTFLLANWATVRALSGLPDGGPLVLSVAWAIVGCVLVLVLILHSRESTGSSWWHAFVGRDDVEIVEDANARERCPPACAPAAGEARGATATNAEAIVAAAVVPIARHRQRRRGRSRRYEAAFEDVVEKIPGADLVAEVIDFVLIPGRLGIRIMATVMKRPAGERPRA